MRTPVIAGNWKMHKTVPEARALARAIRAEAGEVSDREVVLAPPYTALAAVAEEIRGSRLELAAQDVHWEPKGAFTGEISIPMLEDSGCSLAIVGHSERRQYFGETDETAGDRARAALDAGMFVIACVGETEAQRERGETEDVLRRQLSVLEPDDNLVVAYEPVWAIGTGKTATPKIAQEAHAFVKTLLPLPVLYGGSVKPDNAAELLAQPDVDGALVGGASLDLDSFTAICRAAIRS